MSKWTMGVGVAALMVAASGVVQAQNCKGKVVTDIQVDSGPVSETQQALFGKVKNATDGTLALRIEFVNFHPARKDASSVVLKKGEGWSGMLGLGNDPSKGGYVLSVDRRLMTTKPYVYIHHCVVEKKK